MLNIQPSEILQGIISGQRWHIQAGGEQKPEADDHWQLAAIAQGYREAVAKLPIASRNQGREWHRKAEKALREKSLPIQASAEIQESNQYQVLRYAAELEALRALGDDPGTNLRVLEQLRKFAGLPH